MGPSLYGFIRLQDYILHCFNACVQLLLNVSHLQLALEEAQLELAARGQQLLDASAVIKSKDNLVSF
eukprot:1142057-Pelagomonas_calceolata.AAC.1